MKKLLLVILLVLSLSGCSGKYKGWKEIEIENLGSIKIPEGWTYHIQDNEIYFVDEGVTEFIVENVHLGGYIYDEDYTLAAHKLFDESTNYEETNESQVYSNDTFRGIEKYCIDGKWCEKGYVQLCVSEKDKEIFMIAWDDTVSYDDLEKIAKSFDRNLPEEIEKEKRK